MLPLPACPSPSAFILDFVPFFPQHITKLGTLRLDDSGNMNVEKVGG
jgi:hypothetical protein